MDPNKMPEFLKLQKDNLGNKSTKKVLMTDVMLEYKDVQALRSSQKLVVNNPSSRLKDGLSESQMKELQSNSAVIKIDENKLKESKALFSVKREIDSKSKKNNLVQSNNIALNKIQENGNNNIKQNSSSNISKHNNIQQNSSSNISKNNNIQQSANNIKPSQPAPLKIVTSSANNIQQNNASNINTSSNNNITKFPKEDNNNFDILHGISEEERRMIEIALKMSKETYELEKFKYNNSNMNENIKKLNTEVVKLLKFYILNNFREAKDLVRNLFLKIPLVENLKLSDYGW
jgi:hypothetical protein